MRRQSRTSQANARTPCFRFGIVSGLCARGEGRRVSVMAILSGRQHSLTSVNVPSALSNSNHIVSTDLPVSSPGSWASSPVALPWLVSSGRKQSNVLPTQTPPTPSTLTALLDPAQILHRTRRQSHLPRLLHSTRRVLAWTWTQGTSSKGVVRADQVSESVQLVGLDIFSYRS